MVYLRSAGAKVAFFFRGVNVPHEGVVVAVCAGVAPVVVVGKILFSGRVEGGGGAVRFHEKRQHSGIHSQAISFREGLKNRVSLRGNEDLSSVLCPP